MAHVTETIDHAALTQLAESGAVRSADVIGRGDGWGIVIRCDHSERALAVRRGRIRTFRRFETLVSYLKSLGISRYSVDAAGFDPEQSHTERTRPDAAQRLRSAFEAKAHADWLRAKVAASLADSRPGFAHQDVMDSAQALIDEKRRQRVSPPPA